MAAGGQLAVQIEELSLQIRAHPRRVDLLFGRALLWRDQGALEEAVADLTRVLQLEPGHRSAYVLRGEAHRQLGREEEAIDDYTHALFIDPADVQAYLVRGEANLTQGHYKEAVNDFGKALDLQATCMRALLGRARALLQLERYEEALADARKALGFDPENQDLVRLMASIHMARGENKEAEALLRSLLAEQEQVDADSYLIMGTLHAEAHRAEEAMENFSQAITVDPENARAVHCRAQLHLSLGKLAEAEEDCKLALTLDPGHAESMITMGEVCRLSRRLAESVDWYTSALEKCRPTDRVDVVELHVVRGEARLKLRQYDQAVADFDRALELSPTHMHAYVERCEAFRLQGKFELAMKDYKRAVENGYMHANGFLIQALINFHLGDHDTSVLNCNQALSLDPDFADAFSIRGFIAMLDGKHVSALNDLTKGLVLGATPLESAIAPSPVVTQKDMYDTALIEFEKALELAPRHLYKYGLRKNEAITTTSKLVEEASSTVRQLQMEYGLMDDKDILKELAYIVDNQYLDVTEKLRQLKILETRIHRRKAGEVREDLLNMWRRLGLTEELRGRIWNEIQIALRKEEEGYPVDMELLERCKHEAVRLQAIREAGLTEGSRRFEEWGKQKERCIRAWDELGTPEEERKLQPYPGWEMMDHDVVALTRQAEGLAVQAAEKKERDMRVEGANFCNLVERTIRVHNDCNVLRTQLGPDQQSKSNLHNLGTDIRQAAAAMAKEKARLMKIRHERQKEMYDLFDRADAAFTLLNTKPVDMRSMFKWQMKSLTKSSLKALAELVEYLEFKCKVPRAKGVIKEIKGKLKEAKIAARQEKDKALKKEKKAYVKVVKGEIKLAKVAWVEERKRVNAKKGSDADRNLNEVLKKKLFKKSRKMRREQEYPILPVYDSRYETRPPSLVAWENAEDPEKLVAKRIEKEVMEGPEQAAMSVQNHITVDLSDTKSISAAFELLRIYLDLDRQSVQQSKPNTARTSGSRRGVRR